MKVIQAKTAGFCFGVSHALRKLDKQIAEKIQGRLITLGPIIHNPLVMQEYAKQNVLCIDTLQEVVAGDTVVIRAHGVPQSVEKTLQDIGATVVDATCPRVKKAQLAIQEEAKKRKTLLLLGEPEHPEVRGLLSYANADAKVFSNFEELKKLTLDLQKEYFLAAQTTQGKELFAQCKDYLCTIIPTRFVMLDTICDATRSRQAEVIRLAAEVEAMVVVGGLNSANTRRLAEVAEAQGIPSYHVENVDMLPLEELKKYSVLGLTAGASTPDRHIEIVEEKLKNPC